MLGEVEVFLGYENTLYYDGLEEHRFDRSQESRDSGRHTAEEVLVDLLAVGFGDEPGG